MRTIHRGAATLVAAWLISAAVPVACTASNPVTDWPPQARVAGGGVGIWISRQEIALLPKSGTAWVHLTGVGRLPIVDAGVGDQDDPTNVAVLAKALMAVRLGDETLRNQVIDAVGSIIGTEVGSRTLAVGRKLPAYVIAADLVGLPPEVDAHFREWLAAVLRTELDGSSLRETHERRPNNWGTHAGAARAAVAVNLGSQIEIQRTAQVFHGWLGDRSTYSGFEYGELSWQFDPSQPVGINPMGASRDGHSLDGVLPDDQRRSGPYLWPPPHENYVWEALQGALVQAVILSRAGYDVWSWQNGALLRAYRWLYFVAMYPAQGDDTWQLPLVDRMLGTHIWDGSAVRPGKNMGFTDWTHGSPHP